MAVVTKSGVDNLSDFVPSNIKEIEKTMNLKGIIDFSPAKNLPLTNY